MTEKVNLTESEDYKKALEHSKKVYRGLKKVLKLRSKGQLIDIVINYASDLQELQGICQQLLEENKELKGE